MSYLYSLRLALDPGWTDEAGLAVLPELIGAGRIDDVMVFANVEELNTGTPTRPNGSGTATSPSGWPRWPPRPARPCRSTPGTP